MRHWLTMRWNFPYHQEIAGTVGTVREVVKGYVKVKKRKV